jgi:hypothetical protein
MPGKAFKETQAGVDALDERITGITQGKLLGGDAQKSAIDALAAAKEAVKSVEERCKASEKEGGRANAEVARALEDAKLAQKAAKDAVDTAARAMKAFSGESKLPAKKYRRNGKASRKPNPP